MIARTLRVATLALATFISSCGGDDPPLDYEGLVRAAQEKEAQARQLAADTACSESNQCAALVFRFTRATCRNYFYAPLSLLAAQAPAAIQAAAEQRLLAEQALQVSPYPIPPCLAPTPFYPPTLMPVCVQKRCEMAASG